MTLLTRRGILGGLMSTVAAPALARLMPVQDMLTIETSADGVLWEHYGMPTPVYHGGTSRWFRLYFDGYTLRQEEIPWEEFYLPCGQSEPEPDIPA